MSEERRNELRDEQVVYAIHRQDRTFLPPREHCPLCPTRPGGEQTEIPFPAFEIAVFENRFPAFEAPRGAAEVVVYTDRHDDSFGTLAPERAEALMWVWRERYEELGARADVEVRDDLREPRRGGRGDAAPSPRADLRLPVPAARSAGSSSPPTSAWAAARRARCSTVSSTDGRRIVYENEGVVAYVPYAARWPYEAHVMLREHRPSLLDCDAEELRLLADGLQALARGYDALFDRPFPYVMVVHQAPHRGDHPPCHGPRPRRPPGRRVRRQSADTCTSSSTRRCAPPRSSSTSRAPSRARARSSPTCCPRSRPPSCARRSCVRVSVTTAFAPGRVNLIGEHTDYNEGLALPFAIAEGVVVRAEAVEPGSRRRPAHLRPRTRPRRGGRVRARRDPPARRAGARSCGAPPPSLQRAGVPLVGARLEIGGDLEQGAGLSSSAALEVALLASPCADCFRRSRPHAGRARRSTGSRSRACARAWRTTGWGRRPGCSTSSHRSSAAAETALRIDFRTLSVEPVPLRLGGWRFVVVDSGERHANASSGYNERRAQCERACELLGVETLRDASAASRGRAAAAAARPRRARARRKRAGRGDRCGACGRKTCPRWAGSSTPPTRACATSTRSRRRRSSAPSSDCARTAPRARG